MLTVVDEFSREYLAICVKCKMTSFDMLDTLADLSLITGTPAHIRSDNGPEFTANLIRKWLVNLGVGALFIVPGSPWETGYIKSFNGKLRDELQKGEISYSL